MTILYPTEDREGEDTDDLLDQRVDKSCAIEGWDQEMIKMGGGYSCGGNCKRIWKTWKWNEVTNEKLKGKLGGQS